MKKIIFKIICTLAIVSVVLLISCENEDDIETATTFSRLFMPPQFSSSVNGTNVTFSWTGVGDGVYSLELSRDSLLFTTDLEVYEIEGATEYTLELWGYTDYSARVKAVSKNPDVKDSKYMETFFTVGGEDIFYSTPQEEIGENSVLLKWIQGKTVSQIIGSSPESNDEITINLSAEDIAAGQKLIEGLTNLSQGVPYTFKIFNGEQQRGTITISKIVTVKINENTDAGWHDLGTYYFLANSGSFTRIRNDASGYVIADAFRFTKGGSEIIIDNTDSRVSTVGAWTTSTSAADRIGANYFHDGNTGKGQKSITYTPNIPESGYWTVSLYSPAASNYGVNVPVDIFAGEEKY